MKYAMFSDIHSNLEALEVTLEFLKNQNIDKYICCGDIVGYGPNPNECIEKIKSLKNILIVMGNHDAACSGLKEINWFNEYAQEAILWTRKQLKENNRMYILELPKLITETQPLNSGTGFTIVHGSPRDPIDEYLLDKTQLIENLNYFSTQLCFVGHTHMPFLFTKISGFTIQNEREKIKLQENYRYIINVGSVGQPRDFDPRTCCLIYDSSIQEMELFRLTYDFTKTQDKMYKARLPTFLIERLSWGR